MTTKRDIGQEILDSIEDLKAGRVGRVHFVVTPEEVRATRARLNVSQSTFAKMLNISVRTVQDWEQGRRRPQGAAQSLLAIASARPDVFKDMFVPT